MKGRYSGIRFGLASLLFGSTPVWGDGEQASSSIEGFIEDGVSECLEGLEPELVLSEKCHSISQRGSRTGTGYGTWRDEGLPSRFAYTPRYAGPPKSPGGAAVLSLVVPGLGLFYQGRRGLGTLHLVLDLAILGAGIACYARREECVRPSGWIRVGEHYHPYQRAANVLFAVALLHRIGCALESFFLCRRMRAGAPRVRRARVSLWISPRVDTCGASLTCPF
ncbi:MAG: hypothetical protein ACYTHM_20370 [Planctomycetota bacterium]